MKQKSYSNALIDSTVRMADRSQVLIAQSQRAAELGNDLDEKIF